MAEEWGRKKHILSVDYTPDTVLVAFSCPGSLSPHGISAAQTAQDDYPISQVEKLRLKEIKRPAQVYATSKGQSQNSSLGILQPAPGFFLLYRATILDPSTV